MAVGSYYGTSDSVLQFPHLKGRSKELGIPKLSPEHVTCAHIPDWSGGGRLKKEKKSVCVRQREGGTDSPCV